MRLAFHADMPMIVVLSQRLALCGALGDWLGQSDAESTLVRIDRSEVTPEIADAAHVLVDLPGVPTTDDEWIAEVLDSASWGARLGMVDLLDRATAQRAFSLGLTRLVHSSWEQEALVTAITGPGALASSFALTGPAPAAADARRLVESLSVRELEVLSSIAEGLSVPAIAEVLGISEHTVSTHRRRALAKLRARTQAEAALVLARAWS